MMITNVSNGEGVFARQITYRNSKGFAWKQYYVCVALPVNYYMG